MRVESKVKRIFAILPVLGICVLLAAGCATGDGKASDDGGPGDGGSIVVELPSGTGYQADPAAPGVDKTDEVDGTAGKATADDPRPTVSPPPQTDAPQANTTAMDDPGDTRPDSMTEETRESNSETAADTPKPSTETEPPAAPALPDEPVVLTIFGDGVSSESAWTLGELQSMREGYREYTYSTTNNWPRYGHISAHGISLPYLLQQSDIREGAAGLKLTATDGYHVIVTLEQAFGMRYAYRNHTVDGSEGESMVEPVIAWEWGEGGARPEKIRSFFGQRSPNEVNTSTFVQDICSIEVLTDFPGVWAMPGASVESGSVVPSGTKLELLHDSMDSVKVYYTIDGSTPDYSSPVYNPSTSFFQPELTVPLKLTDSVTVKAFAAGYGKETSAIVEFDYIVEK